MEETMELKNIKAGIRVKIVKLYDTEGMIINQKNLDVRQVGVNGTITRLVPGHGSDVWFVQHDESTDIGAYTFEEFEEIEKNASPQ